MNDEKYFVYHTNEDEEADYMYEFNDIRGIENHINGCLDNLTIVKIKDNN